jgi:hypothetical protein
MLSPNRGLKVGHQEMRDAAVGWEPSRGVGYDERHYRFGGLWVNGPEPVQVSMHRPAAEASCDCLSSKVRNRPVPIERANAT